MTALEQYIADLSEDVPEALIKAVKDAAGCREAVQIGTSTDGLEEIHDHLLRNRAMIERLEYLTTTLGLLKSRSANRVADRRGAYDDVYNKAATKTSVGFNDYTSAKEKDAAANVAATEELYNLRKAERVHRDIDSAWDYCRVLLRGAEGAQRDLEARMRLISLRASFA